MDDSGRKAFTGKKQGNYVGYEYKEILADNSMVSLLLDGYENFGWEVSESLPENSIGGNPGGSQKTAIRLKRDRKIINKAELVKRGINCYKILFVHSSLMRVDAGWEYSRNTHV